MKLKRIFETVAVTGKDKPRVLARIELKKSNIKGQCYALQNKK